MHTPVVVIGTGGHAVEVCSYLALLNEGHSRLRLMGCIGDLPAIEGSDFMHVVGDFQFLAEFIRATPELQAITATSDNALRRLYVARVESVSPRAVGWLTLAHPLACVGPNVEIGAGSCLAPGSVITARARIGRHCILNVNSSVSHDAILGDFVNLNPGAVVAGGARLGNGTYIGAGATVVDKVRIGEGAVVGAGAVVLEDLPANATAVGVPARVIKYHGTSWEPVPASRRA